MSNVNKCNAYNNETFLEPYRLAADIYTVLENISDNLNLYDDNDKMNICSVYESKFNISDKISK